MSVLEQTEDVLPENKKEFPHAGDFARSGFLLW